MEGHSCIFLTSDPDSSIAELGFPAANIADSFMLSSSSDPLTVGSAIKFSQCGGSHKVNLKAGFVQFPYVLEKINSKFAYMFLTSPLSLSKHFDVLQSRMKTHPLTPEVIATQMEAS